jgi:hypothetical protein
LLIKSTALLLLLATSLCGAQRPASQSVPGVVQPTSTEYLKLAAQVENALHTDVLNAWFPRSIDNQHGGFHSHFARNCEPRPSDWKVLGFSRANDLGRFSRCVAGAGTQSTPILDHDSYGPDVETAYLMLETDEALHHKASEKTERMAQMLVDHALAYGWDQKYGGFFPCRLVTTGS